MTEQMVHSFYLAFSVFTSHPLGFPRTLSTCQRAHDVFSVGTLLLSPGHLNLLLEQNSWNNWNLILKLFSSLGMILVALS